MLRSDQTNNTDGETREKMKRKRSGLQFRKTPPPKKKKRTTHQKPPEQKKTPKHTKKKKNQEKGGDDKTKSIGCIKSRLFCGEPVERGKSGDSLLPRRREKEIAGTFRELGQANFTEVKGKKP